MLRKIFSSLTALGVVLSSLSAHAGLVTINGYSFDDRGQTTLDLQTGIEWLDVTATANRSYNDVLLDITTEGGTFSLAEGWRYAAFEDIKTLFRGSLAPQFTGPYKSVINQEQQVADFINLFGDTFVDYYGDNYIVLDHSKATATGRSLGWYLTPEDTNRINFAQVNDGDFILTMNPPSPPGVYQQDQRDSVETQAFYGDTAQWRDYTYFQFGSWLVRDAASVPEPSPFALLTLGGMALLLRARKITRAERV